METLSRYFEGVAVKRLSAVEADATRSNQHEFNGITGFREVLGVDRRVFESTFIHFDEDGVPTEASATATWYDARANNLNRNAEYRLYYEPNEASALYRAGDLVAIALRPDRSLLVLSTPSEGPLARQIAMLLGVSMPNGRSVVVSRDRIGTAVDHVGRTILRSIGIEPTVAESDADLVEREFGPTFPSTREFSDFSRRHAPPTNALDDPDEALLNWLETEERLFRAHEARLVGERVRTGFLRSEGEADVDAFVRYSLTVHNRRKSRAGNAFENHVEEILHIWGLRYERGARTEGRSKPDFLLPGRAEYLDLSFPVERLVVLGAKTTCKDRWRQVLDEAMRVSEKHLLTIEAGISQDQTSTMRDRRLQLVVPHAIHATYAPVQRKWLWTLRTFLEFAKRTQ
jgi:hypothetical protein